MVVVVVVVVVTSPSRLKLSIERGLLHFCAGKAGT